MWKADVAPALAYEHLGNLGRRWDHVQTVGKLADELLSGDLIPTDVWAAAWLHDVGYAKPLRRYGMHSLDGALYLESVGAPRETVALVAWHTGAKHEARTRGLSFQFLLMPTPDDAWLDALTLLDLSSAPDGTFTTPESRVAEILTRYERGSAVHEAVSASRSELLASSTRGRQVLGLPDMWPISDS